MNARWYPASASRKRSSGGWVSLRQAMVVMPQWNADAIQPQCAVRRSSIGLVISAVFGFQSRTTTFGRPAELGTVRLCGFRSNIGRTASAACRQAVVDIRSLPGLARSSKGMSSLGCWGPALGPAMRLLRRAHDARIQVVRVQHMRRRGLAMWCGRGRARAIFMQALEEAGTDAGDDVREGLPG